MKNFESQDDQFDILILGIGNILLGDEGVGVRVVEELQKQTLPNNVLCLDGGTGGFHLLDPMQKAKKIILIDATIDSSLPGTITRLVPKFSSHYPKGLSAHDIGLKDLIDSFYLMGIVPEIILYAITIPGIGSVSLELSSEVQKGISDVIPMILKELESNS